MMTSSNGNIKASRLLAFCVGNSPVTGEFPVQRPVTRSFDVSFDLRLNQLMSKPWRRWWFKTPSCSLWRHCNVIGISVFELRSLVSVQVVKLELIVLTVTLSELHDVTHRQPRGCCSIAHSVLLQKRHQSSALLALYVKNCWPLDSPHKGLVNRKGCQCHYVIIKCRVSFASP